MNLSLDDLFTAAPKDAAKLLYEAGRTLHGKNLRRGSWLEIAYALQVQRTALILLPRLQAATTRDDALRVLRLARKWARVRKSGGAKRAKAIVRPTTIVHEDFQLQDSLLADDLYWDEYFEFEIYGQVRGPEFARAPAHQPAFDELHVANVQPATPIELPLIDYAFARRVQPDDLASTIRGRLPDTTVRQLQALGERQPVELATTERDFFAHYDLARLRDWVQQPDRAATAQRLPITTGYELAGVALLLNYGLTLAAFEVDWSSLSTWWLARLAQPPADDYQALLLAGYVFGLHAPVQVLRALSTELEQLHHAWLPVLFTWAARRAEWWPRPIERPVPKPRFPQFLFEVSRPHATRLPWETLAAIGFGSRLVLHALRLNWSDAARFEQGPPALREDLIDVLIAGSGTLRRMAYPAFTLTCRPTISLVKLPTFINLVELAQTLSRWMLHVQQAGPVAAVLDWIDELYRRRQPIGWTPETRAALYAALSRHAIGYALLKWRSLSDQFQPGGFRLRRKHIQQFWRDQAAGAYPELVVPQSLRDLQRDLGMDELIEALASALLDHFKDMWPTADDEPIGLKEECIGALRRLALIYHLPTLRTPVRPIEADLSRAGEAADLLIGQLQHAPLELASALMIPHQQGLPRLTGGSLTDWERQCRLLLREVAGSLRVLDPQAGLQVFECQPISKLAALERGTLGGDCSTSSVPFRALSPHYMYYGIFQNGEQQRGYMTVYEAWAEWPTGERAPVLCLETINVPIKAFESVQGDLLEIFSAIAHSRGLHGLVLITGLSTWNYQNGEVLRWSRRFRQGTPVDLSPADPAMWNLYATLTAEGEYYSAFPSPDRRSRETDLFRVLAPFDAAQDHIQPENQAEADRLRALPPHKLIVTARGEHNAIGFISELPTVW